jgi:hypothetical protein
MLPPAFVVSCLRPHPDVVKQPIYFSEAAELGRADAAATSTSAAGDTKAAGRSPPGSGETEAATTRGAGRDLF